MDNDGLAAFFLARLGEAQRTAKALENAAQFPGKRPDFWGCGGPAAEAYWEDFTPQRALADIAADRALLDLHDEAEPSQLRHGHWEGHGSNERWIRDEPDECPVCREDVPCRTVRIRAARFSSHPEYREEWAP